MKTVAVYSGADRTSPYVLKTSGAYCIAPLSSTNSYLNMDKIFEVMKIEDEITYTKPGIVTHIHIDSVDNVKKGNSYYENF
jgi:acetyl/propionyl-CoA carboxylase alpha subunit